jgi:hypothetical protein
VFVTVNVLPVAPVLHVIVPLQPAAVKTADSVEQISVLSEVKLGAEGFPPEVIVTLLDAGLVPQVFLQIALYVPATATVNVLPVTPLLHVIVPEQLDEVKIAVSVPQRLVLSALTVGDSGEPPLVITTTFDLPLTPQVFVQVAVYVPALTWILELVAPVLQVTVPVQPVDVKVAFSVSHTPILSVEITGATGELLRLITVPWLGWLSPQAFLQVAVYVPDTLTLILDAVAPVLQVTVPEQPDAVIVAVSVPQIFVLLAVSVGIAGAGVSDITITLLCPLWPQTLPQVAVYVPVVLTVILLPVAPVVHFTVLLQPEAVNVDVSVPQRLTLFALIIGAAGAELVVIITWFDGKLSPQPIPVHFAV